MLRTVISHLGKKLVFKRHLPRDFGGSPILVSPAAALSYWYRDLNRVDPFLFLMVGELVKPNSIVWDIGANIGLFSFAAAQVAAVETWFQKKVAGDPAVHEKWRALVDIYVARSRGGGR